MTTAITPTKLALELRDKNFILKEKLEVSINNNLQWEWNRFGGCGRMTFTIPGDYLFPKISADDDIQLWIENSNGDGATRRFRGLVESNTPALQGASNGDIQVECFGYFSLLLRIIVQALNNKKIYTSQELSLIVIDIVDNFIAANSSITRGTIDAGSFTADSLVFKSNAQDCIRTLFDLAGDIECGVDADLEFFWRKQSNSVLNPFWVRNSITKYSEKINNKDIKNKIYFEGGESGGGVLRGFARSQDSISRYGIHEAIVQNGSIVTTSVMNQYLASLLTQFAKPQRQVDASLKNIDVFFEANSPMGAVSLIDGDSSQAKAKWGKTASGGSNRIWGLVNNGGSGQLYGGTRKEQIERIVYTLSPEDGKVHADLTLGNPIAFSRASADMKRIETIQDTLRQRQL